MYSRRALLRTAALAPWLPGYGQSHRPLGVQLYTVRKIVQNDPLAILRSLAAIGYREAEMLRSQIAPLAPYLQDVPLRPVSIHFESPLVTGNWQSWKEDDMPIIDENATFDQAVVEAKQHGFEYMVFNYLPPKERGGLSFYSALSDKLNAAGEKCRKAGLQLCYHNHDFEFQPKPGGRPIDTLLSRLDRNLVRLEVDVFWVSMAGEDAAAFIARNAGRVEMVHLKDRKRGTPHAFDVESVSDDTFREVGRGDLNFQKILQAASAAKVKHYFVEQDHSADPVASLRQSYTELHRLGF